MEVDMSTTNLTELKWEPVSHKDGTMFLDVGSTVTFKTIATPRIRSIDMKKGIVVIEERFMKMVDEEGELFTLSLHLASQDAFAWVVTQLTERAKSPY